MRRADHVDDRWEERGRQPVTQYAATRDDGGVRNGTESRNIVVHDHPVVLHVGGQGPPLLFLHADPR
jgi:hypothetical protein